MIESDDFIAGALSLDFITTVGGILAGVHSDRLETYQDLLEWAVLGGAVTRAQADTLRMIARRRPEVSARTLDEAKALREALHAIFSAERKRRPPSRQTV